MACDNSKLWGYLTVIGATLVYLSLGYNYTTGNMNPYLISYMGITAGETVWFHAVIIAFQAVAMPIGSLFASKLGFRPVVALGCLMCRLVSLKLLIVNVL